jgi:hypothetical protein
MGEAAPAGPVAANKRGRTAKKKPEAKAVGGGISIQDIEAVKKLVERMGVEKVRQLAGVLAE